MQFTNLPSRASPSIQAASTAMTHVTLLASNVQPVPVTKAARLALSMFVLYHGKGKNSALGLWQISGSKSSTSVVQRRMVLPSRCSVETRSNANVFIV